MTYRIGQLFLYFLLVEFLFSNRYDLINSFDLAAIWADYTESRQSTTLLLTSTFSFFLYSLFSYLILMRGYPGRKGGSIVAIIASSLLVMGIRYTLEEILLPLTMGFDNYSDNYTVKAYILDNLYYALVYSAVGLLYFFAQYSRYAERQKQELIVQNKQTELALLRSQFNPHFLFNTLNNIYYLVHKKSEDALDAIQKLSQLLRYSLYEAPERVSIQKEIDYLNNFLELQKMRYAYEPNLQLDIDVKAPEVEIAPFLLIPFVENAFKHGDLSLPEEPVFIRLESDRDSLHLEVGNPVREQQKDKASGIGLENVKRRLQLLYPDAHRLEIKEENNRFLVELSLNIRP